MVKRMLALSLLMVGLAGCGSGGGASAEADTRNSTPAPNCLCSVLTFTPAGGHIVESKLADLSLCNYNVKSYPIGCAAYPELCTLIQPKWSTPNVGWLRCYINWDVMKGFVQYNKMRKVIYVKTVDTRVDKGKNKRHSLNIRWKNEEAKKYTEEFKNEAVKLVT